MTDRDIKCARLRKPDSMAPNILLDTLLAELGLASDRELSDVLELSIGTIDDIRNQNGPIPPGVLVVLNERTGMPVYRMRALIAIEPALGTA